MEDDFEKYKELIKVSWSKDFWCNLKFLLEKDGKDFL